eukprot:TRINITY_DN32748_c0_g1_i1.p1 TRINITY_DN32748_c0_g1~~TRINITY_DN32748_c0_g1_i1.p1  ORF type:complete len:179 (+),score=43.49 TRINITY_DN32748_c0_g1_i1:77-613(+)
MVRVGDKQGPKKFAKQGCRISVSGLPQAIKKTVLQDKFGDFGQIVKLDVPTDKAMAYIEYEDPQDAADAVQDMDGAKIEGQKVTVQRADEKPRAYFTGYAVGEGRGMLPSPPRKSSAEADAAAAGKRQSDDRAARRGEDDRRRSRERRSRSRRRSSDRREGSARPRTSDRRSRSRRRR